MNHDVELPLRSIRGFTAVLVLIGVIFGAGCSPSIETSSLPISGAPVGGASADVVASAPESPSLLKADQLHLEPLTVNPPYVYRVVEKVGRGEPLFFTSIQSCGVVKPHTALSSLRLLLSGLSNVRVSPGKRVHIRSEQFAIQEGTAQLDKQKIFLRVLSVPPSTGTGPTSEGSETKTPTKLDCLTDHVVWSSSNDDLTNRAVAAFTLLFRTPSGVPSSSSPN